MPFPVHESACVLASLHVSGFGIQECGFVFSTGNWYRKAPAEDNIGSWGGTCTCPNGQVYDVGDTGNCVSIACEGGVPSTCERQPRPERSGMKVTCGMPSRVCLLLLLLLTNGANLTGTPARLCSRPRRS